MLEAVGRATITSNEGEGLYVVNADYGFTEVSRQIASLEAEAAALQSAADELTPKIAAAESDRNSKQLALNVAISALTGDDPDDSTAKSSVDKATQDLLHALATKEVLEAQSGRASARLATIEGKIEALQALTLTADKFAWCCDYTDDAAGQVATVEIAGEQPQLLVVPGATPPDGSEGLMTNRLAMSPAATFVNAAILPGWQKFAPTYRVGEIIEISYGFDTCVVDLDAAASSAHALDINQASVLFDVPIQYMECNAAIFEVGDRVVARFENQDWEQPKVIGFEREPRPCTEWLWAGVNDRVTTPVTQTNRLTAKINPSTLATEDSWNINIVDSVGITRRLLNAPLTRGISGQLIDPRDGTIYWTPDHGHSTTIFGASVQMSLNRRGDRMLNALYGNGFITSPDDGDRLYDWPAGDFLAILDDPAVLVAGQKADNGQQSATSDSGLIFMVSGYQVPDEQRTAYAIYSTNGAPLFTGALGGIDQLSPNGAAAGEGYFAATVPDNENQNVYLMSEATGALVNTMTSAGFATRWQDVAIRNDKLFLISYTGSPGNYVHSVSRYSLPGLVFEDSAVIGWGTVTGFRADLGCID